MADQKSTPEMPPVPQQLVCIICEQQILFDQDGAFNVTFDSKLGRKVQSGPFHMRCFNQKLANSAVDPQ